MSFIDNLDEPLLAELYSYWSQRRRGRKVPARADIDPIDIPQLLPHVTLTELVDAKADAGFRIRFRLAGTQIEERFGCPLTNRYLDELVEGPFVQYVMDLYARLIDEMAPLYSEARFGADFAEALHAKRLMLPLSDDQVRVNMVLAGVVFFDGNPNKRKTILRSHEQFVSTTSRNS